MGSIKLVDGIQKDLGGTECELFAIAFATTFAFHGDPAETTYNQALMRSHLLHCYTRDPGTIPIAIFYIIYALPDDHYYQAYSYGYVHIQYCIVSMMIQTYNDLI